MRRRPGPGSSGSATISACEVLSRSSSRFAMASSDGFNPNSDGPASVLAGRSGCGNMFVETGARCGSSLLLSRGLPARFSRRLSPAGVASCELATAGVGAVRRASRGVPHIPQKRKAGELSSPQFGQITVVSPNNCTIIVYAQEGRPEGLSARIKMLVRKVFQPCPKLEKRHYLQHYRPL